MNGQEPSTKNHADGALAQLLELRAAYIKLETENAALKADVAELRFEVCAKCAAKDSPHCQPTCWIRRMAKKARG